MNRSAASVSISARGSGTTANELGDGTVAAVRLRIAPGVVGLEAPPPGFAPGFLGGQKIRKIDRRHLGPDPAGATEIGDPRLRANARTGEHDGLARPVDNASELGYLMIVRHAGSLANQPRRAKFGVRSLRDGRSHCLSRVRRVCRRARP